MRKRDEAIERGLATIDPLAGEDTEALAAEADPDELLARILATPTLGPAERESLLRRRRPAPPRWRKPAFLVASLAAAGLIVIAVGIPGGGGGGVETLPALTRVAEAAAAQPAPSTDFPYRYEKTREINLGTSIANHRAWSVREASTTERWIATNGSGLERREADAPQWASPADREEWEAAGRIPFLAHGWKPHAEEHRYGPGHFRGHFPVAGDRAAPDLADLPTDPQKLAAWIESVAHDPSSEHGPDGTGLAPERAMTLVTDLLIEPLASPELRAALFEALGSVAGLEYFGEVTDAAGRPGVAVGIDSSYSGGPTRSMVIFDPRTSQVLATEEVWLAKASGMPSEAGELAGALLFLEARGANSLGG